MALPTLVFLMSRCEQDHGHQGGEQDDQFGRADDVGYRLHEVEIRDQSRERQEIGSLHQQHIILQENRHPDGADQWRKARGATQRPICDLFQGIAVGAGIDDGNYSGENQDRYSAHPVNRADTGDDQGDKSTDHVDFAVCEVDQLNNPVHHGVPQGNQGIDTSPGQPSEEEFKKIVHNKTEASRVGQSPAERKNHLQP